MIEHTLIYTHKQRGFCKAVPETMPKPETVSPKASNAEDIVNHYIKGQLDVSNYSRHGHAMKAERKQQR